MADFVVDIIVDPRKAERGIKRVEKRLDATAVATTRLRKLLKTAFVGFGAILLVRQLVELTDTFTNLQNRIRIVVSGQAELARVTEDLLQVSNRSRSSFEGTAILYQRVALATRELGVDTGNLANIVESVNKAIIVSGASAKEANNGLIQLSQGIAANRLGGDELRSVLEQLPFVADVIARQLGVTRGELRRFGEEGKITGEVIVNAFRNARGVIEEQFAKTIPTLAQSFVVLRNNVVAFTGRLNESVALTRSLGRAIIVLGDNLDLLLASTVAVAAALAALKLGPRIQAFIELNLAVKQGRAILLGSAVAARAKAAADVEAAVAAQAATAAELARQKALLVSIQRETLLNSSIIGRRQFVLALAATEQSLLPLRAQIAAQTDALAAAEIRVAAAQRTAATSTNGLTAALVKLRLAILANPIGFFVAGVLALTVALVGLDGTLDVVSRGIRVLGKAATVALSAPAALLRPLGAALGLVRDDVEAFLLALSSAGLLLGALLVANPFGAIALAVAGLVIGLGTVNRELDRLLGTAGPTEAGRLNNQIKALSDVLMRAEERVKDLRNELSRRDNRLLSQQLANAEERAKRTRIQITLLTGELKRLRDPRAFAIETAFADLEKEGQALRLSNRAREVRTELLKLEKALRPQTGELGPEEKERFRLLLQSNQALSDQADVLERIRGPQEQFNVQLAAATALLNDGILTRREFIDFERKLRDELEKSTQSRRDGMTVFEEAIRSARQEIRVLGRDAEAQERARILIDAKTEARQKGQKVTRDDLVLLNQLLQTEQQATRVAAVRQVALDAAFATTQQLNDINLARIQIEENVTLSLEERALALQKLKVLEAELGTTVADGLVRGLARIREQMMDLATVTETALVNAFQSAEDALVEFVTTGMFNFEQFALDIIGDITRIVSRLLILQAFQFFTGGGEIKATELVAGAVTLEAAAITIGVVTPGLLAAATVLQAAASTLLIANTIGAASGGIPGSQLGGPVPANQPRFVGEQGVEIFNPQSSGQVISNDATMAALAQAGVGGRGAAPQVTVNVPPPTINISATVDAKGIVAAGLDGDEGDELIVTKVGNNRENINQRLAR